MSAARQGFRPAFPRPLAYTHADGLFFAPVAQPGTV